MADGIIKTVLFITPGGRTAPGGITRMVDYCVRAWPADSDFRLRVVDSYGPGPKWLMPVYALRAWVITLYLLTRGRVRLLHINFSERLSIWRKGLFLLLADAFHVPVILHLHGAEFADYVRKIGPLRRRWLIALLNRAQQLIVLGSYWRDFMADELGIDAARVTVLCNAVPDIGPLQHMRSGECRILFLGVVCERKGIPTLLKALAYPRMKKTPDWKMIIAGGGEVDVYKTMAEDMGVSGRVEFTGLLAEQQVREELARADILVLPSKLEGLPMAILEALSYGCPVVATPVGSIPDAVLHEETGLLIPPQDAYALAEALERLVRDPAARERMGKNARSLYERKFTIVHYNTVLAHIYTRLTG